MWAGFPAGDTHLGTSRFTYDLMAAKPHPVRPTHKPVLGDLAVSTVFQVPHFDYSSFDSTGAATTAGSYGYLKPDEDSDVGGATEAVTTYEQLRTEATVLVVNVTDGDDDPQSGFYESVAEGDLVEWREADDCWARYQVTGDATGTGAVRSVPVRPYAYSATGCSGTVSASEAARFDWDPPDIPYPALMYPIRYGPWLLVPHRVDWTGELEPTVRVREKPEVPTGSTHPLYRAPTVPDDWVSWPHGWGDDPNYFPEWGYEHHYRGADGYPAVTIDGLIPARLPIRFDQVLRRGSWYFEARVIEGYPAIVSYVLEHKLDGFSRWYSTLVVLHDPETGLEFWVAGHHATLQGNQVEGTIAIALSLMKNGTGQ